MHFRIKNLLTPGAILAAISFILLIVAYIIYGVNVTSAGYFQGYDSGAIALCSWLGIIGLAGYLVLSTFEVEHGTYTGNIIAIGRSLLISLAVCCIISAGIMYIGDRAEGLAYIYFSDSNVLAEVQTAANLSSGSTTIVGTVIYLISWLFALVSSFFHIGNEKGESARIRNDELSENN